MLCCSEGMLRNSESLISSQSSNSCCDPDASILKRNSRISAHSNLYTIFSGTLHNNVYKIYTLVYLIQLFYIILRSCIIWHVTCSNISLQCPAPSNIFVCYKCIRLANALCPAHLNVFIRKPKHIKTCSAWMSKNTSYEFCKTKKTVIKMTRSHILN